MQELEPINQEFLTCFFGFGSNFTKGVLLAHPRNTYTYGILSKVYKYDFDPGCSRTPLLRTPALKSQW